MTGTLVRQGRGAWISLATLLVLSGCGGSTVPREVKSIQVTPCFPSVPAGVTQTFKVIGTYTDNSTADISADVSWTSAVPAVATVTAAGVATAVAVGTSNITATCAVAAACQSYSGSATLNVTAATLVSIAATPDGASVAKGMTQQFTATGTYTDGTVVVLTSQATWASATPAVATISALGLADAVGTGVSGITATFSGTASPAVTLTVTAATLTSIQISAPGGSIVQNTSQQYRASGTYSDGSSSDITTNVTWNSTSPTVATFPSSGAPGDVAALQAGTTAITASLGTIGSNQLALTVSAASTTLAASVSTLALSVLNAALNPALTGTARQITITNTGTGTATGITVSPAGLPAGTTVTSGCAAALLPGASCSLTVTPGATPSAAAGDPNPIPATLIVQGSNTNALNPTVSVLTYGSVYESGYLFSVDDTTAIAGSIGGKVFALADQAGSGSIWSQSYDAVSGIDEVSTSTAAAPALPSPNAAGYAACNGATDGACNQGNLNIYYSGSAMAADAVKLCDPPLGGYSDWYLPAICELGYDAVNTGTGCGSSASPTLQNVQSSLLDNPVIGPLSAPYYWSSTESSVLPDAWAFIEGFATGGNSGQYVAAKSASVVGVRCVRSLTQ